MRRWLSVPRRADSLGLHWEMFWPCVTLMAVCAAPLGWGFAPLMLGTA